MDTPKNLNLFIQNKGEFYDNKDIETKRSYKNYWITTINNLFRNFKGQLP